MLMYRVEDCLTGMHRGRLSSYSGRFGAVDKSSWWQGEALRPVPWEDGIPKRLHKRDGWIYGCRYLSLIHAWFSPYDLFLLGMSGAFLCCYEILEERNVWHGRHQSVFYKDSSRLVSRESTLAHTFVSDLEQCELDPEEIQHLIDCEHLAAWQWSTKEPVWDNEFFGSTL